MVSTGHLPKFEEDAYHIERDDLWAIPTAEVPLTSMWRGDILDEADSRSGSPRPRPASAARQGPPAATPGACCGYTSSTRWSCSPTPPPSRRPACWTRSWPGPRRCSGIWVSSTGSSTSAPATWAAPSARTFDLEVYSPGVDQWLEVSSVSWFSDYQARRANIRYRPAGGGGPVLVHTLNGSALAWARIWAALVENGRQADGSVALPEVLAPYLRGEMVIPAAG